VNDKKRCDDAVIDRMNEQHQCDAGPAAVGCSGRATNRRRRRRRSESDIEALNGQVLQERRHTETVISEQQATRRWYSIVVLYIYTL